MAQKQQFEQEPESETSVFRTLASLSLDELRAKDELQSDETVEEEASTQIMIEALDAEETKGLAETALRQIEQREWGDWVFADGIFVFGCIVALTGILQLLDHATPAVAGWILGSGLVFALYHYANRYLETVTALELVDADTGAVSNLLDSLASPISRVRGVAMRVLARLLPKLTQEEFDKLTWKQQQIWYRALTRLSYRNNAAFVSASVETLARVGDSDSLAALERLALRRKWSRRGKTQRQTVIQACMTLDKRLREAESSTKEIGSEAAPNRLMRAVVEKELERLRKERQTHQQPGMRQAFLIASRVVIVPYLALLTLNLAITGRKWEAIISAILTIAVTQLHRLSLSPQQVESARLLAKQADIHSVGALAEALEWPDSGVRDLAGITLTNLLPELHPSDAGLLSPHQRECLHHVLRMQNAQDDLSLMLAILTALERIGDSTAIPYVERLAASPAVTSGQRRVKEAAERCLPFLRDRADATRGSQMLLRASAPIELAAPDSLLRPANSGGVSEAGQLLRAGDGFIDASRRD